MKFRTQLLVALVGALVLVSVAAGSSDKRKPERTRIVTKACSASSAASRRRDST